MIDNRAVYIGSTRYHTEFCRMLKEAGIEQYFDLPFLLEHQEEHEIFVDGGCYDGENSRMFTKWAGDAQKTIYAFEPDEMNYRTCQRVLEETDGISYRLIPSGLWSSEGVLDFCANSNEGSRFSTNGGTRMTATSLDTVINGKVTFIKMDIEGAEYEALRGAEKLIRKYRPKLAVSIYHEATDIWDLPELILSYHPEHTFYLRHYSLSSEETVLHAV